jgi:hypothetical protein
MSKFRISDAVADNESPKSQSTCNHITADIATDEHIALPPSFSMATESITSNVYFPPMAQDYISATYVTIPANFSRRYRCLPQMPLVSPLTGVW